MTLFPDGKKVTCHVCNNKELLVNLSFLNMSMFCVIAINKNLGSGEWSDKKDANMKAVGMKVTSHK